MNTLFRVLIFNFVFSALVVIPIAMAETVCFQCHDKKEFTKKNVHKPLAKGECGACHNPHVARYERLLYKPGADLCFDCHKKEQKTFQQGIVHQPVSQGECLACHDPHASQSRGLLKSENLSDSCFKCHADLPKQFKVTHDPYAKGRCSSCHYPHQSENMLLLRKEPDALCASCHKETDILSAHPDYPGKLKDCLSCHNPHGSNRKKLVRNTLHKPYAKGCKDCHAKGKMGTENCLRCHEKIKEELYATHNHIIGSAGNACTTCHSPHAGDGKGLFRGANHAQVCRKCHADSMKKSDSKRYKHQNLRDCTNCHAPHGSNQLAMMKTDLNTVCSACHETQGKFTHPVGDKVLDPRTGQQVTCVSCHDSMGTDFKFHLKKSGSKELCIQCHRSY
jgi:predicted CXXCH cytochrome family protein